MDNSKRIFGGRLKQERKKRGLRQEDLAAELKMAASTIKNWEQGRTWPEMPDFIRLCNFFDCDLDYLAGRLDEKTHDLAYICSTTGLSEKTAEAFIKEPEIARALGWLDRDELRSFTNALDNFCSEILVTVQFLGENNPNEQYLTGVHRLRFETAIYKFQEQCRELISKWCDLDGILKDLKQREDAYFAARAEEEAKRQQDIEAARQQPKLSSEELFRNYLKMVEEKEANNG